jgi:hypothetical protein
MKNSIMTVNTKAGIDTERVTNSDKFPNLNEVFICKICYDFDKCNRLYRIWEYISL